MLLLFFADFFKHLHGSYPKIFIINDEEDDEEGEGRDEEGKIRKKMTEIEDKNGTTNGNAIILIAS